MVGSGGAALILARLCANTGVRTNPGDVARRVWRVCRGHHGDDRGGGVDRLSSLLDHVRPVRHAQVCDHPGGLLGFLGAQRSGLRVNESVNCRIGELSHIGLDDGRGILPAPEDPQEMHYHRRRGRFRQGFGAAVRPSNPQPLSVVARQLNHVDDMSADVVATQGPGCCDPMMAVENVVLAARCPHLDGREWLTLAHGEQYAAQAGASSITDRLEVPVEQLRCAVDRPYDAGDRDELFAGVPKLPRRASDLLQQRKSRTSTSAEHPNAVPLPPQPIKVEDTIQAGVPGASRGVGTGNDPLEDENATYRGEDSHQVKEELAQNQGHLPLWTGPFPASPERTAFASSSSQDCTFNVVRRGLIPPVTSGRVIAGQVSGPDTSSAELSPTSTARKPTVLRDPFAPQKLFRLRRDPACDP